MENQFFDLDAEIDAISEEILSEVAHDILMEETLEELESLDEASQSFSDSEIDSFAQEFINEEVVESRETLIAEELRQQGCSEDRIEELTEKGIEMMGESLPTKNIYEPKEKSSSHPEKKVGSEGSSRTFNYPTQPEKRSDPPLPQGEKSAHVPSSRERLEAMREGIKEYLDSDYVSPHKEEQFTEKLEEIESKLENLPPDTEEPEVEIEDVSDEEAQSEGWKDNRERKTWKEGTAGHDQFLTETSKRQKLNAVRGRLSVGITNEDLGECGSAQSRIVARAHLPQHMLPENMDEPYDTEELEEEIRLATEEAEELEDKDPEENSEEESSDENSEE